ncbi:MAG: peptidoglycan-associated lipoprotein Pal [Hydrogenophilaceae bacterium]
MNKIQRVCLVLAVLFLGGCADLKELTGTSDVPIEERGAATTGSAAQGATGASSQGVETAALPAVGSGDGREMAANLQGTQSGRSSVVGVSPEQAAMLKDPNNPLSKRIIYFDFDSDAIREEFRGLIEGHAGFLKGNSAARIILQGHTDERGSRDYNLALGQRRAESVKQALTLMGVKSDQVETVSLGEEKPVSEGHDETAWKQNRRAEIHYLGE